MAKLELELTLDTKEVQPLVALCKNQMDLIAALHERVKSSVLDMRVNEMVKSIEELRINEHLTYIQHEAFEAGVSITREGWNAEYGMDDEAVGEAFNEWRGRTE